MTHNIKNRQSLSRRDVLRRASTVSMMIGVGLVTTTGPAAATNKAELIDSIASDPDISRRNVKKALDAFIDTTTKALKKGNRVALNGFGSFSISKRSARKGRNPQTGKEIKIPANKTVEFTPTPELAAALDLTPGAGDQRRAEAPSNGRTVPGPDADIVIDDQLIAKKVNEETKRESDQRFTKADAKRALDAFIDTTTKALKKGNRVALNGFGSFSISKRSARKGRNPQTGKEIKIPARKVVKFKPGAELSEQVQQTGENNDDEQTLGPSVGDSARMEGKVKFFNEAKGFGLIKHNESGEEYFVHATGLIDEIRDEDDVTFELREGRKGMNAVDVRRTD